jgi:flagellar biosynthesis/type III secretory pathway chaperone
MNRNLVGSILGRLATFDRQDTGRRQSRDIGNIWLARHRTKTIQRHWQHLTDKAQDDDNPEKLATFYRHDIEPRQSRDIGNNWQTRQSRDIGNIWQKRHRTKTIQTLATFDRQDTGRRQSRDIGNVWQARHRTKTIQRHWQHLTDKTQDEDNPETLAAFER